MPLDKSKSKKAIGNNIETEQKAGKPHDQAVAIALHTAHPNEKGYAEGGLVQEEKPDAFYEQVGQETSNGINHDMDAVKDFLMQLYNSKGVPEAGSTLGTDNTGLQGLANQAAGVPSNAPSRGYAHGGMVQGYAPGGEVTDPNEITDTSGIDAIANAGAPPIQFNPQAGLPLAPAPQAPLNVDPNAITNYLSQQKAALGKYGPEQQMAVSNDILGRQNGVRGTIANAGAGLADALMQGVARAGNPGFQQNLQNRQDKQAELQLNALKGAREANVQNVEQGSKLDAMDPNSAQSKAAQASQGLFLSALGFDPKTISKMSAVQIPEAISTIKDLGIKDRELAVAKFKAQIEANQLAETTRSHKAEESNKAKELAETAKEHGVQAGLKGEEIQSGQLEKLAAEPITSRLSNLVGLNPAQTSLEKNAGVKPVSLSNVLPHPQDDQAIQWANAHPNDPRAVQIKRLHGLQ